jgi:hypothetical protein
MDICGVDIASNRENMRTPPGNNKKREEQGGINPPLQRKRQQGNQQGDHRPIQKGLQ